MSQYTFPPYGPKSAWINAQERGMNPKNVDDSTLLMMLLRESSTTGKAVWLNEGTYNTSITIDKTMNGAKLAGVGTMRGIGGRAPVLVNADAGTGNNINGFIFEGITIDGAGVVSCVVTTGAGPWSNVTFDRVRFQNTASAGSSGQTYAIADGSGVQYVTVRDCVFEASLGGGCGFIDPHGLKIENNWFLGSAVGNFIGVTWYSGAEPYYTGQYDGLVISGNVGFNGKRMAVELFGNGARLGRGVVVTDNWFDTTGGSYTYSIVGCHGAQIIGNTAVTDNTYCFEIGSAPIIVEGNYCYNGQTGVMLNNAFGSTCVGNHFFNNNVAIATTTSGDGGNVSGVDISDNYIEDARDVGIQLGSGGTNPRSGGSTISHNRIHRWRVDADDATRRFYGIQSSAPNDAPNIYIDNWVVQEAANPTLQVFGGFFFSGVNTKKSRVKDAHVISKSSVPFGSGIVSNNPGALDGFELINGDFQNLVTPMDVALQQGGTISMAGNWTDHLTANSDSRGFYNALSIPPAKAGELTTLAGPYIGIRGHATTVPVAGDGYFRTGDIVLNRTPTEFGVAGSKYVIQGWICTATGSPGNWLPMRALTGN